VEAIGKCDTEKISQPDCRIDTDCPGELKCCEAACGRRVCSSSIKRKYMISWKYIVFSKALEISFIIRLY
jgi:hypothetical protein